MAAGTNYRYLVVSRKRHVGRGIIAIVRVEARMKSGFTANRVTMKRSGTVLSLQQPCGQGSR
ncbi:MAG: hypothetical protein IPP22_10460 [Nitrosomonas sp.]|nr:hypothetical protein [Nitrosomonas sp.]